MAERVQREFYISYFSEVSAAITIKTDGSGILCTATHPRDGVPIDCWFHFSDHSLPEEPLQLGGTAIVGILRKLGDVLYPGAKPILEQWESVDQPRVKFFTDLFFAFTYGEWVAHDPDYPRTWPHQVGEKLCYSG